MLMNRVQFQPGLSLPEFIRQFGSEAQCEVALIQTRWPQGFRCPQCDHDGHCVLARKSLKPFSATPATTKPRFLREPSFRAATCR